MTDVVIACVMYHSDTVHELVICCITVTSYKSEEFLVFVKRVCVVKFVAMTFCVWNRLAHT